MKKVLGRAALWEVTRPPPELMMRAAGPVVRRFAALKLRKSKGQNSLAS